MDQNDQSMAALITPLPPSARMHSPALQFDDHSSAPSPKLPTSPSSLYIPILAQFPVNDTRSVTTLLNASLVSRAFAAAASSPFVWQSHSDFRWRHSSALEWVKLPSTCDEQDQQLLDDLFGRSANTQPSQLRGVRLRGRDEFRVRLAVDQLGGEHLRRLIWSGGSKLKSFDVLCALGDQLEDGVYRETERWTRPKEGDPTEDRELCVRYWLTELRRSRERRTAASYWRGIDRGDLCPSDLDAREWDHASFSAFTDHNIWQAHQAPRAVLHSVWPRILKRLPDPWTEMKDLPITESDLVVKAKLILCAESLFRLIIHELALEAIVPAHPQSKESKSLDGSFLDLVVHSACDRKSIIHDGAELEAALIERGADPAEIKSALKFYTSSIRPTSSLTSFAHILISVAASLPEYHSLHLEPTMEPHLLSSLLTQYWPQDPSVRPERVVRAGVLFDLLTGEVYLRPDGKEESHRLINPCESIRRVASDLCSALASPNLRPSHHVSLQAARYAQLLVPSVISQPYEGPEAVIRLSAAAVKLAEHVGRHFPFDVSLLETTVLPLVWGTHAKKFIEGVIKRVKEEHERTTQRRRINVVGPQPARVGSLCKIVALDYCVGVVTGWDEMYDATSAARARVSEDELLPDTLEHGREQPFYTVILSPPYDSIDVPYSYYAAEELLFDGDLVFDDLVELSRVHEVGRWFVDGRVEEGEGQGTFGFVPSAELQAMYPDD